MGWGVGMIRFTYCIRVYEAVRLLCPFKSDQKSEQEVSRRFAGSSQSSRTTTKNIELRNGYSCVLHDAAINPRPFGAEDRR